MTAPFTRRELGQAAIGAWIASLAGASGEAPGWREHFPILSDPRTAKEVYLDSAATTHRPRAVIQAMTAFYERGNANPGRTLHRLAREAHTSYESARTMLARFLNAASADEIVWTRGTTEAINLVAAWAERTLRTGDEILLTRCEHSSNLLPWRFAARRTGARLVFADVDDAGRIDVADLRRKLGRRTRFLAFSHVSNVVGYVNPAAQICALARAAGAYSLVDAAQSAPHLELDVRELGCDFVAFSAHKMLGPMGTGVLWARSALLEEMSPYQSGSNMAHDVGLQSEVLESGAHKFGAGTPNVSGAVGHASAVAFLEWLDRGAVARHEQSLVEHGLERLQRVPGLRILGPTHPADRIPVFSFVIHGHEPGEVLRHLDNFGIAVRAGDLSALPLLERLGARTAVRASAYLYTRNAELDQLAEALKGLARRG